MSLVLWIQLKVGQSEQEGGGGGADLHTAVRPEGCVCVCVRAEAGCSTKETMQPHQEVGYKKSKRRGRGRDEE